MDAPRIILITGTSKGIGRSLAAHYASKGHKVVGCSRSPTAYANDNYQHYCLDVADEPAVRRMFGDIRKQHRRLDVLINNAALATMNHALLTPTSTARDILSTNVIGTFLFCREAAKLMRRNAGGRIVNFGTIATPLKLEGEAIYAASKAAVVSLTQILAREFAQFGITVNAIAPSPLKTGMTVGVPNAIMERLLERQAIRRYAEIEDVANVVDFFIKPESGFITGQTIYLGGA